MLKPQVVQQLIQGYGAPTIAERLKLNLVGTRQEIAQGVAAYGARNAKVTDADLQAYYTENKAQFESPASATVSEASFKDQAKAVAFRNSYTRGDFVSAASKAGGTVSERGDVTAGDGKLSEELNAAVFSARSLKDAADGSLSDVVKVGERYSVLYVTDLKPAETRSFAEVRDQIEPVVLAQEKGSEGQTFLDAQIKTLKPTDKLKDVLAAQEKRVAAQAPKAPATPAEDGAATDGAKTDAAKTDATPPTSDK
nr:peptidylprolyl isomerase [Deinococcus sp. JMULE3]